MSGLVIRRDGFQTELKLGINDARLRLLPEGAVGIFRGVFAPLGDGFVVLLQAKAQAADGEKRLLLPIREFCTRNCPIRFMKASNALIASSDFPWVIIARASEVEASAARACCGWSFKNERNDSTS